MFLSSADFFSKSTVLKNSFRNTISVKQVLNPDQAPQNWVQTVFKSDQQMALVGKEFTPVFGT